MTAERSVRSMEVVPAGVKVVVSERDGTTAILLEGELDLSSADDVREALRGALARGPKRLVLDLSGLSFMDSTGAGVTMDAGLRASLRGVELLIVPGPPAVQRVFEVLDLVERLPFDPERC